MRILIVEDDPILADGLVHALRQSSYIVDWAKTGEEADDNFESREYDLVILDLGLPRKDGLEVLRQLRLQGVRTPVLILTARDSVEDRVAGLDSGADDYLIKPFDLAELEARARALIRRGQGGVETTIEIGPIRYDMNGRRVFIGDAPIDLSARELSVFEILALRAGRVVSKEQLADRLGGVEDAMNPGAIEVYVHRLRKKLEAARIPIRTIRGLGYLLEKPRAS
jgi:two-component system, OmpR family, response regulator